MNNLPQEWLRSGRTLDELKTLYSIDAKRHSTIPSLVLLKYNQIESPMNEPLVRQCRGLILDEADNWKIVCWSFDKFSNYGESTADTIDWNTAKIQEKLDGSLMQLSFYAGEWAVASSGTPDAGGNVNGFDFSFAELFWKVWNEKGFDVNQLNPCISYAFELMTPYNKIVVQHKSNKLVLIGARSLLNGKEYDIHHSNFNFSFDNTREGLQLSKVLPKVKVYDPKNLEELLATLPDLDPFKSEGYVVVDKDFKRIKIKSPKYVALHHVKSSWSPRSMLQIVRTGEINEACCAFPEFAEEMIKTKEKLEALILLLENTYQQHKHLESQKDFALAIKGIPMTGALFQLRKGTVGSIREYLGVNVTIDSLAAALGI